MLGLPAEEIAGAGDVELVIRIGVIDHPWTDESVLLQDFVLHPGPGPGERLGYLARLPFLIVDQFRGRALYLVETQRLKLPEEEYRIWRQLFAAIDD